MIPEQQVNKTGGPALKDLPLKGQFLFWRGYQQAIEDMMDLSSNQLDKLQYRMDGIKQAIKSEDVVPLSVR
jgi:hypothetical protein